MVGERGFEPPTPWSRNRSRIAISLVRLGWYCVVVSLIAGCSAAIGPKLDPSLGVTSGRWFAYRVSAALNGGSQSGSVTILPSEPVSHPVARENGEAGDELAITRGRSWRSGLNLCPYAARHAFFAPTSGRLSGPPIVWAARQTPVRHLLVWGTRPPRCALLRAGPLDYARGRLWQSGKNRISKGVGISRSHTSGRLSGPPIVWPPAD